MNWHRTPRKWAAVIGVVGLAGALSAVGISWGATTVHVSDSKGLLPSKLPKQRYVPASLNVVVHSTTDTPEETPVATTDVVLDFDDDGKITTKGLAICNANLQALTTQQARSQCARSFIGRGAARAIAPGGIETTAVVSAFNGPKQGGNPTIRLHSATSLGINIVLTGTIDPNGASGDYGARLHVPVGAQTPPGTIITRFATTVEKSWRFRGKKYSYITARCHDGNKTLNIKGAFEMASGPNQTATDTQRCKVRR
jgi:hypothetical protein